MYESFYKLKEKPFDLNPSPRFLYLSDTHKEALALLTYGVMERKGFILLTGEVGTGKTTVVQTLIASLERNIQYIFISNPLMSRQDFLNYIAFNTFNKKIHFKSKSDFLIEFEEYLKTCRQHQKTFVLIIDESQTLSYELLEEIRLLSNLELADEKLINIFLIGQPELNDKLAEPRCRPILQRINNRYHLKPLDLASTRTYVATRLKVAGIDKVEDIFPEKTIKALYEYSEGYPRIINVLADNALLLGYSQEKKKITPAMIKDSYEDVNIRPLTSHRKSETSDLPAPEKLPKPAAEHRWKWVFVFLVTLIIAFIAFSLLPNQLDFRILLKQLERDILAPAEVSSTRKEPESPQDQADLRITVPNNRVNEKVMVPLEIKPEKKDSQLTTPVEILQKQPDKIALAPEIKETPSTRVTVKRGDTLTRLSIEIYGRSDSELLDLIKKANPGLHNINLISIGQEIIFPSLPSIKEESHYTVQIGSFEDFNEAQQLFQKLIQGGNMAYILPTADKEQAFRVTLGSFQNRLAAEQYALELLQKNVSQNVEVIEVKLN